MTVLTRSLLDSARRIRATEIGARLVGEADESITFGASFPCLILSPASTEVADAADRVRGEGAGAARPGWSWTPPDQVEVSSAVHGDHVWQVLGSPEPYRRGRRIAGWTARLRRVS